MKKIFFVVPPTVELLDLAGPVQVFTEAKFYGFEIEMVFVSFKERVISTCGLRFENLEHFSAMTPQEGDFIFIPGMDQNYVNSSSFQGEQRFFEWLKNCSDRKVNVCGVCNGTFVLGEAGLLDGHVCTTHWRRIEELQRRFPAAKVRSDVFYVNDRFPATSGGIACGIDLALSILEKLTDSDFTAKVAKGLVFDRRENTPVARQHLS